MPSPPRVLVEGVVSRAQLICIHLNPARSGLVSDPVEYRLSGHRELLGEVSSPLVDADDALLGFRGTLTETCRRCRRTSTERSSGGSS